MLFFCRDITICCFNLAVLQLFQFLAIVRSARRYKTSFVMPAGEKSGVFAHVHFTNLALLTEVVSRLEDNSIAFIRP